MKTVLKVAAVMASALVAARAADHLTLLPGGATGKFHAPTNGVLGAAWTTVAFNDSTWSNVVAPIGFDMPNAPIGASGVIADSATEFSGVQGASNWYYGYWDKTADADSTYQAWDFVAFPREAGNNTPGPNNFWDGSKWDWFNGNPPWSELSATGGHANHPNGGSGPANAHHYVIRRWVSEVGGMARLVGTMSHGGGCGDGVDFRVFVDGVEVLAAPTVFQTSIPFAVNVDVQVGSTVDFAVGPNTANDFCDGFSFSAKVLQNTLADSVEDFSGAQGVRGWAYGYYDKSADGDGVYHPDTDFNSSDANFGFAGNAWQLGAGGNVLANPPFTAIGRTEVQPGGANNGAEHWAIRRYTSSYAGPVRILGTLSIFQGCGGGTRARIFVDGAQVFARDLSGTSVGYSVLANVSVGSRIDFALDPNGDDACDATTWTATIQPAAPSVQLTADSAAEFSGTQGHENWFYGFYDRTADGNAAYDPATEFNTTDPNWTFSGAWALGPGDPSWASLGATEIHPGGINNGAEQWVIRRWVSEVTGVVTVDWHFAKSDPEGEGASLLILHNGVQVDAASIAGNDRVGITRALALHVRAGDFVDFAHTPMGPGGDPGDGADGSLFNARIYAHAYNPNGTCTLVADSQADWSFAGEQGYLGWRYGYYNKSTDGSAGYQPDEFTEYPHDGNGWSPTDFWDGGAWNWNPDITPWDTIAQVFVHPNGINSGDEHWPIRRWASTASGTLRVDWFTRKANPFGSGVTGKILHNGVEMATASIADQAGFRHSLTIPGVTIGDAVDLALTPLGPSGAGDDSGDGSENGMTLFICTNVIDSVTTDVLDQMKNMNATAYLRVPFTSPDPLCLDELRLRMKYDDGFVAYINGVEVARRNAPSSVPGWNSRATASRTIIEALETEVIDITAFKSALLEGGNILAIHVLNRCTDDPDLLIAPEITATVLPPEILAQPQTQTVLLDHTATFSVVVRTCATATFQWRFNGMDLPGETADTLLIPSDYPNEGSYDVVVSNVGGSRTSLVATLTVNRNPVALDNGLSTAMNMPALIPGLKLLNNDSDPDADAFSIVSVASATSQGGAAIFAAGNITYSPAPGFTGTDTFTYSISDGRGGTATATIEVFVYSGALPSQNRVLLMPTENGYKVRFAGIPGKHYLVERATDLAPPAIWTTLQTLTAPAHGIMEFEDATALPQAYYRTIAAP